MPAYLTFLVTTCMLSRPWAFTLRPASLPRPRYIPGSNTSSRHTYCARVSRKVMCVPCHALPYSTLPNPTLPASPATKCCIPRHNLLPSPLRRGGSYLDRHSPLERVCCRLAPQQNQPALRFVRPVDLDFKRTTADFHRKEGAENTACVDRG